MDENKTLEEIMNEQIAFLKSNFHKGFNQKNISDGWHTFGELYEFRKVYNAALFNEWAKNYDPDYSGIFKSDFPNYSKIGKHYNVHKSWKHNDGEYCFGVEKESFIVSAKLPTGLISNHYKAKDWDLFKVPETEKALFPFDGHTGKDVLERIKVIL